MFCFILYLDCLSNCYFLDLCYLSEDIRIVFNYSFVVICLVEWGNFLI